MKRLTSIGLLLLYLVSSTEFSEILRLPLLVEHYTEHKNKVDDLTFWQFLVMHYETDVAHDDTDMSLPFKSCGHSLSVSIVVLPGQPISLSDPLVTISPASQFFYLRYEPNLLVGDIFQPPKI